MVTWTVRTIAVTLSRVLTAPVTFDIEDDEHVLCCELVAGTPPRMLVYVAKSAK